MLSTSLLSKGHTAPQMSNAALGVCVYDAKLSGRGQDCRPQESELGDDFKPMQRALEIILILVIIGTTLTFGGVQPLTLSLMEVTLLLCLLARLVQQARQGEVNLRLPIWPALFLALVGLQVVPLPSSLVGWLAAARVAGPDVAGLSQAHANRMTISIYPHDTLVAFFKLLAYVCAFILAADVFDSRKRRSLLVRTLIGLGLFEAAYGTVQYLTGWQKIFAYTKVYYTEEATGTYINHNHFAGFLELTTPFVLGFVFYAFQNWTGARKDGARPTPSRAPGAAGGQVLLYTFLMTLMVIAVILSRSRAGIIVTIIAIVFVALLAWLRLRRRAWMVGLLLFLVIAAGYGLWIGLGPILTRFEQLGATHELAVEGRISFWKDSIPLIRDYPVAGVGLGNFGTAFRHYQTSMVTLYVDHAHNDYLEFASETGVLGTALLFLPILYLLGKMTLFVAKDPRRFRPTIVLGCVGSTLGIVLHSFIDFNLQVPANALTFAVILGIGYKACCVEPLEETQPAAPAQEARPIRRPNHRQPDVQRAHHP